MKKGGTTQSWTMVRETGTMEVGWMELWPSMWTHHLHPRGHCMTKLRLHGPKPYSTWPVMLLNYNIPPWLSTKKFFIMLALLIPGKQSVTSEFFDVYLEPLVEELVQLWKGVNAYDVLKDLGSRSFRLRAVLLWTIQDFTGYGTVASVAHQGYVACPVCGQHFKGEHSVELGKQTYTDTRRWLPHDDPWRSPSMKDHFNGCEEERGKPNVVTAEEQVHRASEYHNWLDEGNKEGGVGDPSKVHGVKRRSILHNLPYWKVMTKLHLHFDSRIRRSECPF